MTDPATLDAREHDRRIERLLAEAEAASGPVAWPRVEALVTALVDLYGRGLARILAHAREAAGSASADLDEQLQRDELVASLLVLHGLHPVPVEARVARALRRVESELPDAAPLSLVSVDSGTVTLRVAEGARPPPTQVVARAVELEAPELAGVRVVGGEVAKPAAREPAIVPVERLKRGGSR